MGDAGVAEEERGDEVLISPGVRQYVGTGCVNLAIPVADGDGVRKVQLVIGMRGRRWQGRSQNRGRHTVLGAKAKLLTFGSTICCMCGPSAVSCLSSIVAVICPSSQCHPIRVAM